MIDYEMIKNSTISELTYSEMNLLLKNKTIYNCNEAELLEVMLELISDKILIMIKAQEETIDYLEDMVRDVDRHLMQGSIDKCSLKAAILKEVRNMINEL